MKMKTSWLCLIATWLVGFVATALLHGEVPDRGSFSNADVVAQLQHRGIEYKSVNIVTNGAEVTVWLSLAGISNPCLPALRGMDIDCLDLCLASDVDYDAITNIPLKWLDVSGTQIKDLIPISKVPLRALFASHTAIRDLSPIHALNLRDLHLENTDITSLEAIKDMHLEVLNICKTHVSDLSPVNCVSLKTLMIKDTNIRDVQALHYARLETLVWTPEMITNGVSVIRDMKSLQAINGMQPNEFWNKYDKAGSGSGLNGAKSR